jgi:RES domain-containing protein
MRAIRPRGAAIRRARCVIRASMRVAANALRAPRNCYAPLRVHARVPMLPRMRLWRMSAQTTLREASWQPQAGRWHYAGRAVLYVSRSPELAVLEARVHHRVGMDGYVVSSLWVPDHLRARTLTLAELPADWRDRKPLTRALGEDWLVAGRYPLLCVPSAVVPLAHNYLVNPAHPAVRGKLRLRAVAPMPFDRRLLEVLRE